MPLVCGGATPRRSSAPALTLFAATIAAVVLSLVGNAAPAWAQRNAPRGLGGQPFGAAAASAAPTRFGNTVNTRFRTVSNGPQNVTIVDVPARADRAAIASAVRGRVLADWRSRARAAAPQLATLRKAGLLSSRGVVPVSTLVVVRQDGRLVVPTASATSRQVGGGALTFTYTGYDQRTIEFLQNLINLFYPRIEALYGRPAWSGQVEIVNVGDADNTGDPNNSDVRRLAFGAFNVSTRQILLPLYDNVDSQAQALLLNLIHAFHGPAAFQYDAWEQGFARAAASIIARDPELKFWTRPPTTCIPC
jgi:hypothetical protein